MKNVVSLNQFKEEFAKRAFGRSRTQSISGQVCVACGKDASKFRDALSRKEFGISGLCQACQDQVFDFCGQ